MRRRIEGWMLRAETASGSTHRTALVFEPSSRVSPPVTRAWKQMENSCRLSAFRQ
jgi:hypothetical protein